jgi:hypothetical protein
MECMRFESNQSQKQQFLLLLPARPPPAAEGGEDGGQKVGELLSAAVPGRTDDCGRECIVSSIRYIGFQKNWKGKQEVTSESAECC